MAQHGDLYDTTLRDGAQFEGISFSVDDKLAITRRLDELGVQYIEGGVPPGPIQRTLSFSGAPGTSSSRARCSPRSVAPVGPG